MSQAWLWLEFCCSGLSVSASTTTGHLPQARPPGLREFRRLIDLASLRLGEHTEHKSTSYPCSADSASMTAAKQTASLS
ncbi:MAG: hypothetical protein ACRDK2_12050, partial [Solirubrobacteraceae bacterium]